MQLVSKQVWKTNSQTKWRFTRWDEEDGSLASHSARAFERKNNFPIFFSFNIVLTEKNLNRSAPFPSKGLIKSFCSILVDCATFFSVFVLTHSLTHPFAEEELVSQRPVIHAQTVGEDQGLEGVRHDVFFGQEVVGEELLHPAIIVFVLLAEMTDIVKTVQLLFNLSRPEKGEFSHLLHGDVFTGLASKHRVVLHGLEYKSLRQRKDWKKYLLLT